MIHGRHAACTLAQARRPAGAITPIDGTDFTTFRRHARRRSMLIG